VQVVTAKDEAYSKGMPEPMTPLIAACQAEHGYTHILAAANAFGKNLLPRVGAVLDVQPIADISEIVAPDTFVRLIYAGNAVSTVQVGSRPYAAPAMARFISSYRRRDEWQQRN
jgi:electron transfer flavoprotein alpha subunit